MPRSTFRTKIKELKDKLGDRPHVLVSRVVS